MWTEHPVFDEMNSFCVFQIPFFSRLDKGVTSINRPHNSSAGSSGGSGSVHDGPGHFCPDHPVEVEVVVLISLHSDNPSRRTKAELARLSGEGIVACHFMIGLAS